jgi:acetylornithine/succinyldiaminopimelate/putrescine aminotransferase
MVSTAAPPQPALSPGTPTSGTTWNSDKWYGFPQKPFEVDFIPRNDCAAAEAMVGPDIAAVIVEPVQGVAGAFDLSAEFLHALSNSARQHGTLLIADEVLRRLLRDPGA